jgi:starch phosphorylase
VEFLDDSCIILVLCSKTCSTAGNEASGTSNMKFAMNGCLLLATLSGSNIEMQKEIGDENIFVFGAKPEEVDRLRAERRQFQPPQEFHRIIGMIRNGKFGDTEYFQELCQTVDGGNDFYLLGNDFSSYLEAQAAVDEAYVDRKRWTRMSIMSTAGSGNFSIDRTTREYAENIWGIKPVDRL